MSREWPGFCKVRRKAAKPVHPLPTWDAGLCAGDEPPIFRALEEAQYLRGKLSQIQTIYKPPTNRH